MTGPKPKRPDHGLARESVRINGLDIQDNSFASKTDSQDEPIPLKRVSIKGKVRKRKKPMLQSFTETFFGEDVSTVGSFILHDILIPAAKNMVQDAISNGLEMMLFGEKKSDRLDRNGGRSIVSYSNYYNDRKGRDRGRSESSRRGKRIEELIFERRNEAEDVLENLMDLLDEYEQITVADYYDVVGTTSRDYTDQDYGWTNLKRATIDRVRNGYLLNLPRAQLLD